MEEKPSIDDLLHYGVKGMKWGVHRTSEEIDAARERHNKRMDKLDTEATRLSLAKSTAEKKRILNDIHKIAKEAQDSGDLDVASTRKRGEKVATVLLGGPIANYAVKRHMRKQREYADNLIKTYKNAKLSDFHDAN